jgi:uncharacterized membrane protein YhaH (DUF805 family)
MARAKGVAMDFNYLFTSFDGRINRQPYWMGILVMIGIAIVVMVLLGMILGFQSRAFAILGLLIQLALLYPSAALMAKRLHDRNRPTWWVAFILIPSLLQSLAAAFSDPLNPSVAVSFLSLITMLVAIWFFIELGCLRGTVGPNEYGPDPLEVQAAPVR